MFAYRLLSGHWQVQTGVAGIGEDRTVTTGGVVGLNVVTGWEKRSPSGWTWHGLPCAFMWGGNGRGGLTSLTSRGRRRPRPPPPPGSGKPSPPPPAKGYRCPRPEGPGCGHPHGAGGTGPAEGGCG